MHPHATLAMFHAKYDKFKDAVALENLASLLIEAASRLLDLGPEPICVLDAPFSYSKYWSNWRAVRVGADAFHSVDAGKASWSVPVAAWSQASEPLQQANRILQSLMDRQWRSLFFDSFDFDRSWLSVTSLALLIDFDQVFLAAESDGFGSPVYKLDPIQGFLLAGESLNLVGDLAGVRPVEWCTTEQCVEARSF